ncbi:MAG: hypothetical protein II038_06075 [Lachnospiraceae bacterium]|nr:hypothetical protein [Lachnospiraceae bacterium]
MALLRSELKGAGSVVHQLRDDGSLGTKVTGIYEGIIETAEDLTLPRLAEYGPGSMFFCLANKNLYSKNSTNEWEVITG